MPAGRRPSGGPVRHANPTYKFAEFPNVPFDGPWPVDADPTWPLETIAWWNGVKTMPHCRGWYITDWNYARDTAGIHAEWINNRRISVLSELRQRESKLGTTMDSRLAIRVKWVDVDGGDGDDATVTPIRKITG